VPDAQRTGTLLPRHTEAVPATRDLQFQASYGQNTEVPAYDLNSRDSMVGYTPIFGNLGVGPFDEKA